ncbi:uncharacterized protein LOC122057610 [Macadamia integrifolia]|uniref:uncharacterized protein LOC122057610 n=1 Tax=Macadamia integrifolia TaxID=60698 RepID=UPI001C53235B|nr:uncharacterized protein LOC122057610 [Macadamia integrifolia]
MLLRNSIAKTKRFFHKNFESFKSFLSGGYERLPKTPPFNPCSCTGTTRGDPNSFQSFRELDNFYRDFSNRWDSSDPDKAKQRNKKNSVPPAMSKKQEEITTESFLKFGRKQSPEKVRHEEQRRTETGQEKRKAHSHRGGGEVASHTQSERNVREKGGQLVVVQKLKELEMMDASDMEHVLDIEEVLHYYSRLTCPAYLDIVEKFFMDMYSEFFLPQPSSASSSSANNNFSRSHKF